MSDLNVPNDNVKDDQMGAYIDEMDQKKIYFTSMNPILTFY